MEWIVGFTTMALLICVCGLGAWLPGRYVLAPLRMYSKLARPPWQFRLVDYFGLFMLLQYALGLIGGAWRVNSHLGQAAAVYLLMTAVIVWLIGVKKLSQARIDDGRRRFVLLSVVLPLVTVTSFCYVPMVINMMRLWAYGGYWPRWYVIIPLVGLPLAMWGCRRLVEWIARGAAGADTDSRLAGLEVSEIAKNHV